MGRPVPTAAWQEIPTVPGMGSPVPDIIPQEHRQKGKNLTWPVKRHAIGRNSAFEGTVCPLAFRTVSLCQTTVSPPLGAG